LLDLSAKVPALTLCRRRMAPKNPVFFLPFQIRRLLFFFLFWSLSLGPLANTSPVFFCRHLCRYFWARIRRPSFFPGLPFSPSKILKRFPPWLIESPGIVPFPPFFYRTFSHVPFRCPSKLPSVVCLFSLTRLCPPLLCTCISYFKFRSWSCSSAFSRSLPRVFVATAITVPLYRSHFSDPCFPLLLFLVLLKGGERSVSVRKNFLSFFERTLSLILFLRL